MEMTFNIPELITKQLAITCYDDGRRKLQISSNYLALLGLGADEKVVERSLGDGRGFVIEPPSLFDAKPKKVYRREYKRRRNNPIETMTETTAKHLLHGAIPTECNNVHITITWKRIEVKPLLARFADKLAALLSRKNPLSVFAACTSGVDCHASEAVGFDVVAALEWRPNESRDKNRDFTETGTVSLLANAAPKILFNEDIYAVDKKAVAKRVAKYSPSVLTISLQCDDVSNVKAKKLKEASEIDLSSTLDMAIEALELVKAVEFPVVLTEQVPVAACKHNPSDLITSEKMGSL